MFRVARDEQRNAQNNQMAEATKSWRPVDPAITAGAKVFLDTKDMPLTYGKCLPHPELTGKLLHCPIRDPTNMRKPLRTRSATQYDNLWHSERQQAQSWPHRRFYGCLAAAASASMDQPCQHKLSHRINRKHWPSSDGSSWHHEVKLEGWDEKDNTWEPEENMAKAEEMVKQYWKEIIRRPKAKRKATHKKAWEACLWFDRGVLFLRELSRRWLDKVVILVDNSGHVQVRVCCIRGSSVALVRLCRRLAYLLVPARCQFDHQ